MPKLEVSFREEVRKLKRQRRNRLQRNVGWLLLAMSVITGFTYLLRSGSSVIETGNLTKVSHPVDMKPVELPKSGVFKKAQSQSPQTHWARLRLFLRTPLPDEKSPLPSDCSERNSTDITGSNQNYFIELLDWDSNKVITTAFVRVGEMVEMRMPIGTYKLRYTAGDRWYGEQQLFGSRVKYEMTERFSPNTAAKFAFTKEGTGGDVGFYCLSGNLSRKQIKDAP